MAEVMGLPDVICLIKSADSGTQSLRVSPVTCREDKQGAVWFNQASDAGTFYTYHQYHHRYHHTLYITGNEEE
jgi:hypothetical protein